MLRNNEFSMPLDDEQNAKQLCVNPGGGRIAVSLIELPPAGQLEMLWRELEPRASGSFFTSWAWIGAWLATYATEARSKSLIRLLVARSDENVIALGIVCRSFQPRPLGGVVNAVLLHQTGRIDDESAFIEYNGFLVDGMMALAASAALLDFIAQSEMLTKGDWAWNEFRISGADRNTLNAIRDSKLPYRTIRECQCRWVDLQKIDPQKKESYFLSLSPNTRSQIRRSLRLIEYSGTITVTAAQTVLEAKFFLAELRTLQQKASHRWKARADAFSSPLFVRFVNVLIETGHKAGHVDLLRVSAGDATVGILLNFVYAGHVYAYQSGFSYSDDNRLKPGLVTHALAIAHYRTRNLDGYHFMAGEGRYKSSLGMATEELTWLVLRRRDFQSMLEDSLRSFKSLLTRR